MSRWRQAVQDAGLTQQVSERIESSRAVLFDDIAVSAALKIFLSAGQSRRPGDPFAIWSSAVAEKNLQRLKIAFSKKKFRKKSPDPQSKQ